MLKTRVVKTGSSARAVQVVSYQNNKRTMVKHFGSSHSEKGLNELLAIAKSWIIDYSSQLSIFPQMADDPLMSIHHFSFLGVYHTFLYELLGKIQVLIGFDELRQPLLHDLVIMRLIEPGSKLRSIELMETYFGIKHQRKAYYKAAPQWLALKERAEGKVLGFAQRHYAFNYDLLFYDVTTLYFETFQDDELRKQGFSKDNKSQQPQILVALMVTKEGFPIAHEIFSGNTFEGNTIIPVVRSFIQKNKVKNFTIIADAAMISTDNISELRKNSINYIVGARLGNLSNDLIDKIDGEIPRQDGKSIRLKTANGYLICSYSSVRYRKDRYEMEKQIEKAKLIIGKPSKNKKTKFIKTEEHKIELNQALIQKTQKLLGLKGYYTDLEETIIPNHVVMERYHELYKIEQAFRISKSDLQARPVFHFKEEPIKLHMLVCFMALAVAKHIELQTLVSIKRFINDCKKIIDARMINKLNNKEIRVRAEITSNVSKYFQLLNLPH